MMYQILIKEYIKKMTINDINNFALKNNIHLAAGEDKIIYDFIKNNYEKVLGGANADKVLQEFKTKVCPETYNHAKQLYDIYKNKI